MNTSTPPLRLAFFPLGRIHFDDNYAQQLSRNIHAQLILHGYETIGDDNILWDSGQVQQALANITRDDIDLILIFQSTFTDSTMVTEIADHANAPLLLWSVPEDWDGGRLRLNSFTGMNLAAHALHKNQIRFFYIYSDLENQKSFDYLKSIATAARVVRQLKSIRIGLIGDHPAGFETSQFDRAQIQDTFAVTVEKQLLEDFFARVSSIPPDRINTTRNDLENKLENLENLNQGALDKSLATYEALLELQTERSLHAMAVRCWPEFFTDLGCSTCGALSLANERGLACTCEADVVGLVTQLILQLLSSTPALGVDIVGLDLEEDTAALWHCGMAPFSMANLNYPLEATNHSNRGLPLLMQFPFKPGPVTLARLTQAGEQMRLILGLGEMLDRPRPFTGTCGIVRLERPASQVLDTIMSIGMEHHISFTYGDFRAELEVVAKLLGLPVVHL